MTPGIKSQVGDLAFTSGKSLDDRRRRIRVVDSQQRVAISRFQCQRQQSPNERRALEAGFANHTPPRAAARRVQLAKKRVYLERFIADLVGASCDAAPKKGDSVSAKGTFLRVLRFTRLDQAATARDPREHRG
jgi:hypothetical protein